MARTNWLPVISGMRKRQRMRPPSSTGTEEISRKVRKPGESTPSREKLAITRDHTPTRSSVRSCLGSEVTRTRQPSESRTWRRARAAGPSSSRTRMFTGRGSVGCVGDAILSSIGGSSTRAAGCAGGGGLRGTCTEGLALGRFGGNLLAVFGQFHGVVGISFILQEAFETLTPPDDVAVGIADARTGLDLIHRIGLVLESHAGMVFAQGDLYRGAAIAAVGKLARDGHAMGFRLVR